MSPSWLLASCCKRAGGEPLVVIGILAIQGDFAAHRRMFDRIGAACREVRTPADIESCAALVLPGGESTTMLKGIAERHLEPAILDLAQSGRPILGTCAGAILLARQVSHPEQPSFGLIDIAIERNAYGRQVDSFIAAATGPAFGSEPIEMVFIRAPIIRQTGPRVNTLLEHAGHPVLVSEGNRLVATFHPELTDDPRIHQHFVRMVEFSDRASRDTKCH